MGSHREEKIRREIPYVQIVVNLIQAAILIGGAVLVVWALSLVPPT